MTMDPMRDLLRSGIITIIVSIALILGLSLYSSGVRAAFSDDSNGVTGLFTIVTIDSSEPGSGRSV